MITLTGRRKVCVLSNPCFCLVRLELAFSEFTTGAPHPLHLRIFGSPPPIVGFQFANIYTEVLRDLIIISVRSRTGETSFYLVP